MAWCLSVYHRYNRYSQGDKYNISTNGVILQLCWHFCISGKLTKNNYIEYMLNFINKGYISFLWNFFHVHIKNIKGYHEFTHIDLYHILYNWYKGQHLMKIHELAFGIQLSSVESKNEIILHYIKKSMCKIEK